MNAHPRLGVLAWLDIPMDCRMTGEVNRDGDVQFTVGGPVDEFDIVFEPAALHRFVELAFGLLCQAARTNPRVLAARDDRQGGADFTYGAEALRKLTKLSGTLSQLDADAGELVGAGGRPG